MANKEKIKRTEQLPFKIAFSIGNLKINEGMISGTGKICICRTATAEQITKVVIQMEIFMDLSFFASKTVFMLFGCLMFLPTNYCLLTHCFEFAFVFSKNGFSEK